MSLYLFVLKFLISHFDGKSISFLLLYKSSVNCFLLLKQNFCLNFCFLVEFQSWLQSDLCLIWLNILITKIGLHFIEIWCLFWALIRNPIEIKIKDKRHRLLVQILSEKNLNNIWKHVLNWILFLLFTD